MKVLPENSEYLLRVLKAALRGEAAPKKPEGTDLAAVFDLAEAHRLTAMAYCALYKAGLPEDITAFKVAHRNAVARSVLLENEFLRIKKELEEREVDFCPLKGWFTRELYPEVSMRTMSDIDILIDAANSEKAKAVMDGLGYKCLRFMGGGDDKYLRPNLLVEFHRTLDSEGLKNPDYYREPMRLTEPYSGRCRRLGVSDSYLYTIAHAKKHFMGAGTGLRTLTDVYLFLEKAPLDREYVEKTAALMGIEKFMHCMEKTALAAFGDGPRDEDTELILSFIAESGVVGSGETLRNAKLIGSGAGSNSPKLINALFPPLKYMKLREPALKKAPVLLPFFYVKRWAQLLLKLGDDETMRLRRIHEASGINE